MAGRKSRQAPAKKIRSTKKPAGKRAKAAKRKKKAPKNKSRKKAASSARRSGPAKKPSRRKAKKLVRKRDAKRTKASGEKASKKTKKKSSRRGKSSLRSQPPGSPLGASGDVTSLAAEDIELGLSTADGDIRLVRISNALAWSTAASAKSVPSFTERHRGRDQGVDAEWLFDTSQHGLPETKLLGAGWTVYQYKQRSVTGRGRDGPIQELKRGLSGELAKVAEVHGVAPAKYVLFTNLDLNHNDKRSLKAAIRRGGPKQPSIEIMGAAEFASSLNAEPHLRTVFFGASRFQVWDGAWVSHENRHALPENSRFVGREEECRRLRAFLEESGTRVVLVTGAAEIGKTRLILEVTSEHNGISIFALDHEFPAEQLRQILEANRELVIVLAGDDPVWVESILRESLRSECPSKIIVSLRSHLSVSGIESGRNARVRELQIGPLSAEDSRVLVSGEEWGFDYSIATWIVSQCRGNPGMLLQAARVGTELRAEGDFTRELAAAQERLVERQYGTDAVRCLEVLSLQSWTDLSAEGRRDVELCIESLGQPADLNALFRGVDTLRRSGYLRLSTKGALVEVVPPALANRLVDNALSGRASLIVPLWNRLSPPAGTRFLRRLSRNANPELDAFWTWVLEESGLFTSVSEALGQPELLEVITQVRPREIAEFIDRELNGLSDAEIVDGSFDSAAVARVLDDLVYWSEAAGVALAALARLGRLEPGEPSLGVARSAFKDACLPHHEQISLSLPSRAAMLERLVRADESARVLAIEAIDHVFSRGSYGLRRSKGPRPYEGRPDLTYGDLWDYEERLADLAVRLLSSDDEQTRRRVGDVIAGIVTNCFLECGRTTALERVRAVCASAGSGTSSIPVTKLVGSLKFVQARLEDGIAEAQDPDRATHLEDLSGAISLEIQKLEEGSWVTRLTRWVGGWAWGDVGEREADQAALEALSKEAISDPALLSESAMRWLGSENAQRSGEFFAHLGALVGSGEFVDRVFGAVGDPHGELNIAGYVAGLAQRDEDAADALLDEKAHGPRLTHAVIWATRNCPSGRRGVERILGILERGMCQPASILDRSACVWFAGLDAELAERLLASAVEEDLENAPALIDVLGMWLHKGRELTASILQISWQLLRAEMYVSPNDDYHFDKLAAACAKVDPEAGFGLVAELLSRSTTRRDGWRIFGFGEKSRFWSVLSGVDRERALKVLVDADVGRSGIRRATLDLEKDADLLVGLASEDEATAVSAACMVAWDMPRFWEVGLRLTEMYPDSDDLRSALTRSVYYLGKATYGPMAIRLGEARRSADWLLRQRMTAPGSRRWLENLSAELAEDITLEEVRDEPNQFNAEAE